MSPYGIPQEPSSLVATLIALTVGLVLFGLYLRARGDR